MPIAAAKSRDVAFIIPISAPGIGVAEQELYRVHAELTALHISDQDINDAEAFIPTTCQENAGMTAPIHAIVWLMLNETLKAEGEFNRSLQACAYGEFHVRNEVSYLILYIYL